MNKGVMQNSGVQQIMATANQSSLWSINNLMRPPFLSSSPSSSSSTITNFLAPPPNYIITHNNLISNNNHNINNIFQVHQDNNMNMSTPSSSWLDDDNHVQEQPPPFPESLSQLLLGGVFMGEGEQVGLQHHHSLVDHVKQENSVNSYNNNNNKNNNINNVYNNTHDQEYQLVGAKATNWSPHQINIPTSSPQSCVSTTFSGGNNNNNIMDFSSKCISDNLHPRHNPLPVSDHSSESNSTANGGALKKPKVQPSSSQSTFKVRKEKLGDRITALHQLVSPFGKTDTASVLLESIGYIRFLHSQIEALSLPYLTNGAGNKMQPHFVKGERKCIFPEDPGQLLNENCLKRKAGPDQDSYEEAKDLRSRGLCLVPLSCTMHVGSDNGADYWAPALGSGGFR